MVVDDTDAAEAVKVALLKPVPMVIEDGVVTTELDELRGITVIDATGLPKLRVHVLVPGV